MTTPFAWWNSFAPDFKSAAATVDRTLVKEDGRKVLNSAFHVLNLNFHHWQSYSGNPLREKEVPLSCWLLWHALHHVSGTRHEEAGWVNQTEPGSEYFCRGSRNVLVFRGHQQCPGQLHQHIACLRFWTRLPKALSITWLHGITSASGRRRCDGNIFDLGSSVEVYKLLPSTTKLSVQDLSAKTTVMSRSTASLSLIPN